MSDRQSLPNEPIFIPQLQCECAAVVRNVSRQKCIVLGCLIQGLPFCLGLTLADARKLASELDHCLASCNTDAERN